MIYERWCQDSLVEHPRIVCEASRFCRRSIFACLADENRNQNVTQLRNGYLGVQFDELEIRVSSFFWYLLCFKRSSARASRACEKPSTIVGVGAGTHRESARTRPRLPKPGAEHPRRAPRRRGSRP